MSFDGVTKLFGCVASATGIRRLPWSVSSLSCAVEALNPHVLCTKRCMSQVSGRDDSQGSAHIRDFAIIAHVDHGKTTLMDRILFHGGKDTAQDRVMDSGVFEKERGITITSKYTSFPFKGFTLNAVDTPGHADFGGEVERYDLSHTHDSRTVFSLIQN